MAELVPSNMSCVPLKKENTDNKHSENFSSSTSGCSENNVSCQTLNKCLKDASEKIIAIQNNIQPASEISPSLSQDFGVADKKSVPILDHGKEKRVLQKATLNSIEVPHDKKNKEAINANCSNSTGDVSSSKTQQDSIHQQAQRLLVRNHPVASNSFASSSIKSVIKENSCSSSTESKSVDSSPNLPSASFVENNSASQSMDGYNFRNRYKEKEKCSKQKENGDLPLGIEVADAYEQLVHGKEGSPKSVNVAARKLLSEHSECRVPEYFQKTLKKDRPVESSPKLPIPRSDFRGPVNISLKDKDYMKNTVKPTVAPCTQFLREVTMDYNVLSNAPASVVTINKDGTEQESVSGQKGNGKKSQTKACITEIEKNFSALADTEDAPPVLTSSSVEKLKKVPEPVKPHQTARKSCAFGISKKASTRKSISSVSDKKEPKLEKVNSMEVVSESKTVLNPVLYAKSGKPHSSNDSKYSDKDSDISGKEDTHTPPSGFKLTARKTLPKTQSPRLKNSKLHSSNDSKNSDKNSDISGKEDTHTPPSGIKLTARKTLPKTPSPRLHHNYFKARKSVPSSFKKKLANDEPKTYKMAEFTLKSASQKSSKPVQNGACLVANSTTASTPRLTVSALCNKNTLSGNITSKTIMVSQVPGKAQQTFVLNTLPVSTEVKNETIKGSCLHAASTQLLPKSTRNGLVTNYVLFPISTQKDCQKNTSSARVSAKLQDPAVVSTQENQLHLSERSDISVQKNSLVGKQKMSVKPANNVLKKNSRKGVDIRRGKRKRKAPRRFQSSQSSDDESPQVSRKRRLVNRRRGTINRINSTQGRKSTRAKALRCKLLFKNKNIDKIHDKQKLNHEQENLLAENTDSKLIPPPKSNQQLKCVKSSKANLLIPAEIVKGRTVNELLTIVESNSSLKNGERPLSILLSASSAVTNLLSPTSTYSQRHLQLQSVAPILLPVTTSVTSDKVCLLRNTDNITKTAVKDTLVDKLVPSEKVSENPEIIVKSVSDTKSHEHAGSVVSSNVNTVTYQSSQGKSSTSVVNQTKNHSDSKSSEQKSSPNVENICSEKSIENIVEIQNLKSNPTTKNTNDILMQKEHVKERTGVSSKQPDSTYSNLSTIKQEVVRGNHTDLASSNFDIQSTSNSPCTGTDTVKPNAPAFAESMLISSDSISDQEKSNRRIPENNKESNSPQNSHENNAAETSVNCVVSSNTIENKGGINGSLEVVSEVSGCENNVKEKCITVNPSEEIIENYIELNNSDDIKNNDVTENVVANDNMLVDLNEGISKPVKDNASAEDAFKIEPSSECELRKSDVPEGGLRKKLYYKQRRKRKLSSLTHAHLMRRKKNKKQRLNLEAMESDQSENASEVSGDFSPSLASSSRSNSVSTLGSLDDYKSSNGTGNATRKKDLKAKPAMCCCQIERQPSGTYPATCQAIEYIDGGLLLCEKEADSSVLFQPSLGVASRVLCKSHRKKASGHGWCPGCGCFCSMGTFMECRRDHTRHHFHSECIGEISDILYCPHCGEDASRAHKVTNVVPEDLALITPAELQSRFHFKLPSALLETVDDHEASPMDEQQYQSTNKKARMGGTQMNLKREFEDKQQDIMNCYSVKLKNGNTINPGLLPPGPTRKTLTTALKCINTFKSRRLGFSPKNLYIPALQGDLMKVIALLVEGFDPNHRFPEHNHETAMHAAANRGHLAILYMLLQAGGNCNTKDEDTQTPLMCAASSQQLECIRHLVSHGADVTCKDDEGTAALHIAAKDGFIEGVRYLTSVDDTDINIQDDGGWTPLVWAAEARHVDVVQYLLERGCDPNIRDKEGNSGLHWAAYAGAQQIIKLFIERNCDVNAVNHNGDTPLTLLMREANTLLKNREEDTPLDCCNPKSNVYLALQVNQKLRQAASLRTLRTERILSKDISRGREARPIQVVNAVDDFSFPKDFLYVAHSCEKSSLNIDRRIIHMKGCNCEDDCSLEECFCAHSSSKCWYNKDGKLVDEFNYQDPPLIFECGRACSCWTTCKNRVVQHGIRCHLQLFRTNQMGWGLRALQKIPKGTFVCEYAGELISDAEADRRQDDSYLFDLDNREGDVYCIDARYYGNISRFINHLCEPNIVPVRIFVDHHDLRFPRIVFFTSRDVNAYEELGFDYGDKFWAIKSKYFNCCCGSPYCKHPLPQPDIDVDDVDEEEEEIVVD
ncbi:uncharacterized protein LOC117120307 isoform X2 [Anneissia japonica]|uniref:uncharacterized protein LOC117120307 isoform X2 n=1 Tax=Anneissia japonica TaxID=1529436 RepID=UPI001425B96B|nr:uncharacterized protein LOC117120307 isoform X2 [Anneissia japonica]